MPSIVPGFEYDIFISYRHKDNKNDGWVTDFVQNLKRELDSTFKEDISIYFDHNAYDGLLETHNVDKSLESKLKCLVFIPIVSQTYCDPKSFAWQNEFCVFNETSKDDQFGRDIVLSNGNVASRILPVKIHDLDAHDTALFGNELGGALRSIEFIYRSPGVNRPLRADDKREDNLNRLFYRDQINKVANAIKEITNGMRFPDRNIGITALRDETYPQNVPAIHEKAASPPEDKSIAVLPFISLSQDPSQEYFADGITENILIQLASLRQLRVISRTSIMRYKKTNKTAPEIASELGVKYILEGSAQTHGNKVRINVQLVDALNDAHMWSKVFVENMDDIFTIQNNVAEFVAKEFQSTLRPNEEDKQPVVPTKNLEAYDLFLKGRHAFNQWSVNGYITASEYFKQAITKDPEFQEAYSYLASSFSARMSWNGDLSPIEAKKHIEKYLNEAWKRNPTVNDYLTKAFLEFFVSKDFKASENLLIKAIELSPNNATVLYTYSYLLNMMGRFQDAKKIVNDAKKIDPLTVAYFNYQTITLYFLGQYDEALNVLREGLQLYPAVLRLYDFMGRIYLTTSKYSDAIDSLMMGLRSSRIRPPSMIAYLASAYEGLNNHEKSNELLNELIRRSEAHEKGVNVYIVYVLSAMGNMESAAQWLDKARVTNDVDLIWWQVDPLLTKLKEALADRKSQSPDFDGAEKNIIELLVAKMPKLNYHNIEHVFDVVNAAVTIAEHEKVTPEELSLVRLAAYMHDAGFIYSPKNHEEKSAEMAREILPAYGLTNDQIEIIANMILATMIPQTPKTLLEKILCDADLDYLGREDFYDVGGRLLDELKKLGVVETEREWNLVQKTFLESHRFHTSYSNDLRDSVKKQRQAEIAEKLKPKSIS